MQPSFLNKLGQALLADVVQQAEPMALRSAVGVKRKHAIGSPDEIGTVSMLAHNQD